MSTFGDLVDRTFRTYLEPPNRQPATTRLQAGIDADDLAMTIGDFAVPDDADLMRNEVLIEGGSELIRVATYDELTGACVIERGADGTTPQSHAAGARLKLAPNFPRQSVFDALADNFIGLYPSVYTVRNVMLQLMQGTAAPLEDELAVDVIELSDTGPGDPYPEIGAHIVDHHPITGGRSLVIPTPIPWAGALWLRYRRRFAMPTSETDTFEDLGMEERWANLVIIGAVADLFVGSDVPESLTDWVGQVLKTEGIRVGSRLSIAAGLRQYQQLLLDIARREMGAEYKPRIRRKKAEAVIW